MSDTYGIPFVPHAGTKEPAELFQEAAIETEEAAEGAPIACGFEVHVHPPRAEERMPETPTEWRAYFARIEAQAIADMPPPPPPPPDYAYRTLEDDLAALRRLKGLPE